MTDALSPLQRLWLCEAVRLREAQAGLLEDNEACRQARATDGSLAQRLQVRGLFLAQRDGLITALQHWLQGAKLALWLFIFGTIIAGAVLAKTALSGTPQAINIFWALAGLIGLNLISLLLWCSGLLLSTSNQPLIGQAWLWLSNRLARDAKAVQLAPALLVLLQRKNLLRWGLGRLLHGCWLLALATAFVTLIALLTTRRYGFVWESTLVASDSFVIMVNYLSIPIAWLGFSVPNSELIQLSGMQALEDEQSRHIWANWLLGMLLVYGMIPRALCYLLCEWRWKAGVGRLQLDPHEAVWQPLHERVQPSSERLGIIDAAPSALHRSSAGSQATGEASVIVAIELDDRVSWPPTLPANVINAGIIDTREQRRSILEQFSSKPPARLLIVCNPQRSADRGTLNLIAELSRTAVQTQVWLLENQAMEERINNWEEQLDALKLTHSRSLPWLWLEHSDV